MNGCRLKSGAVTRRATSTTKHACSSDADCFPMEEDYSCDNGGSCNGWRECLDTQRQYMWTLSAQSGALNQVLGRAHSRGRAFFHTRADSPPPSDVWHA